MDAPIPEGARPPRGTDGQIIINTQTGDDGGFWHASTDGDGAWMAVNGYHYNTGWKRVPPQGFGRRGAKIPYWAGLIRKCEIQRGHIDHAIAFACDYACNRETCGAQSFPFYVYPVAGSEGKRAGGFSRGQETATGSRSHGAGHSKLVR